MAISNYARNDWAPFLDGENFSNACQRLILGTSRRATACISALNKYTTGDASSPADEHSFPAHSYDYNLDSLPWPVIQREMVSAAGYAYTDPFEYLTRTFLCNPLLNDVMHASTSKGASIVVRNATCSYYAALLLYRCLCDLICVLHIM